MAIFDEPSREPLPKTPGLEEIRYVALKGIASLVPGGGELFGLMASPMTQRRDEWLESLERRLRDLEGRVDGFRFDTLGQNEQFVSATLQATHAALRTHQKEKLEALCNAVLNAAAKYEPEDDYQTVFLSLIDRFTPAHLRLLKSFQEPILTKTSSGYLLWRLEGTEDENRGWLQLPRWARDHVPGFREVSKQFIQLLLSDLLSSGLAKPGVVDQSGDGVLVAGPPTGTGLIENLPEGKQWTTEFGSRFLRFIESPLSTE